MKTVVKLIIINLIVTQMVAPFLVSVPYALYLKLTTGSVDTTTVVNGSMILAQLTGQILMILYLWIFGLIKRTRSAWSPTSFSYLWWSIVAVLAAGMVVSAITDCLKWIPDIMEKSFDVLQSGWGGILAIVLVGPVFEELLFRGAIVDALSRDYRPVTVILLSAFLFAVCHLNPAQMIPAFLIGILLAWSYYHTRSLIPCIVMHVANNSLSLYLMMKYPEAEYMDEVLSSSTYLTVVVVSLLLLAFSMWMMGKYRAK